MLLCLSIGGGSSKRLNKQMKKMIRGHLNFQQEEESCTAAQLHSCTSLTYHCGPGVLQQTTADSSHSFLIDPSRAATRSTIPLSSLPSPPRRLSPLREATGGVAGRSRRWLPTHPGRRRLRRRQGRGGVVLGAGDDIDPAGARSRPGGPAHARSRGTRPRRREIPPPAASPWSPRRHALRPIARPARLLLLLVVHLQRFPPEVRGQRASDC